MAYYLQAYSNICEYVSEQEMVQKIKITDEGEKYQPIKDQ